MSSNATASRPLGQYLVNRCACHLEKPSPTDQQSLQGTEQDWVEWFNKIAINELVNPILIAPTVLRKNVAPGTPEQRSEYINCFEDPNNAAMTRFVRACRYHGVFGVWPDGVKSGPDTPNGVGVERMKWAVAQAHPGKYLKWLREKFPETWDAFVLANPKYASQGGKKSETP